MIVLKILGFILAAVFFVVVFAFAVFSLHCLSWFHWRSCKHCGHNMKYRGLKKDGANGHYLFHCPKCGAWQQIPREQFFRDIDEGEAANPYNNIVL